MKYLSKAGRFATVIQDAPKYHMDQRCKAQLPQILHIAWVAHRRESQPVPARRLQQSFLERFSDHPLAAEMYFASAMEALEGSDYDGALRLLKVVERRYPESRLIRKVKRIGRRLEGTVKAKPPK